MNQTEIEKEQLVNPNGRVAIPAMQHPLFRTQYAIQRGVERKIIFKIWGGIGDMICAEPTLRYALEKFKDCEVSLAAEVPELFQHLKFKRVFDLKEELPNLNNYFQFETITPPDESNLVWCFMSHMLTNCVDFPSICALRLQLPVEDKDIRLEPKLPANHEELLLHLEKGVVVHAGKHWQSKTFPKSFWDKVLLTIVNSGKTPILIGADTDDNRGTVDVDTTGCVDLRNKLSINDSIWLCHNTKVVLTNDSSPLHMAASGAAWIGYIATCKHPDMITHWRKIVPDFPGDYSEANLPNKWQWREKNFGKGGIWDIVDFCPNKKQKLEAEFVPEDLLASWLPDPEEYGLWAVSKVDGKF